MKQIFIVLLVSTRLMLIINYYYLFINLFLFHTIITLNSSINWKVQNYNYFRAIIFNINTSFLIDCY